MPTIITFEPIAEGENAGGERMTVEYDAETAAKLAAADAHAREVRLAVLEDEADRETRMSEILAEFLALRVKRAAVVAGQKLAAEMAPADIVAAFEDA